MFFIPLTPYLRLMRLHQPIGIFLLLWPTLWALWIAGQGTPDPLILSVFILGVIIMRSAGCIMNDLADHSFDGKVQRTRERPLVTGRVTRYAAITLCLALLSLALALVLLLNPLTQLLACFAVILAFIYPFMKRFTYWPQLFLGAAFAWSVPMAFAAQTGTIPGIAWLLFIIAVLWPVAYDTMYARVDQEDDKKIGVKSTALLFGRYVCLAVASIQLFVLAGLFGLGIYLHFGSAYYLALLIAAMLAAYQQYLLAKNESQAWFRAFFNNHWFGLVIFLGIAVSYF